MAKTWNCPARTKCAVCARMIELGEVVAGQSRCRHAGCDPLLSVGESVRYRGPLAKIRDRIGRIVPLRCSQSADRWVSVDFGGELGAFELKAENLLHQSTGGTDRGERAAERRALGGGRLMFHDRSLRREVRNPVLSLPAAKQLLAADAPWRPLLRALLLNLAADARERANECWRRHKAPMAVYWKAVAVYDGHIAKVLA